MKALLTSTFLLTYAMAAHAAIYFNGDWASRPADGFTFEEGVTALNSEFSWGSAMAAQASGGNPDSFLEFADWNNVVWVALEAPTTETTYTFSFDYKIESSWDANQRGWEVIAASSGAFLNNVGDPVLGTVTGGTLLHSNTVAIATEWTTISQDVTIPAGYDAFVFRVFRNGMVGSASGVDNLSVSVVPEPQTYALAFALLAAGFAIIKRRKN